MKRLLASVDAFGAPVTLNFYGASKFNTACGGILTLLVYGLSIFIVHELFMQLYHQTDSTIQTYKASELPKADIAVNLLDHNLFTAIKLVGFPNNMIDPRAGRLEITTRTSKGPREISFSEPIELQKC